MKIKIIISSLILLCAVNLSAQDYNAEYYYRSGMEHIKKGNYDLGISDLQKAVALKPDYIDAYRHLGLIYHQKGYLQNAINVYIKALQYEKNDPFIYLQLADTCLKYSEKYEKNTDHQARVNKYLQLAGTCLKMIKEELAAGKTGFSRLSKEQRQNLDQQIMKVNQKLNKTRQAVPVKPQTEMPELMETRETVQEQKSEKPVEPLKKKENTTQEPQPIKHIIKEKPEPEKDAKLESVKQQNQLILQQNQQMQSNLKQLTDLNEQIRISEKLYLMKITDLEKINNDLRKTNQLYNTVIEDLQTRISLQEDKIQYTNNNYSVSNEKNTGIDETPFSNEIIQVLRKENEEYKNRNTALENDLTALKESQATQQVSVQFSEQYDQLKQDYQALVEKSNQKQSSVLQLKEKLKTLEGENEKLSAEVKNLSVTNIRLRVMMNKVLDDKEVHSLKIQNEKELAEKLKMMNREISELEKKTSVQKKEYLQEKQNLMENYQVISNNLQDQIRQLNEKIIVINKEQAQAAVQFKNSQAENKQFSADISQFTQRLNKARSEKKKLLEELDGIKQKLVQLKNENEMYVARIKEKEKESREQTVHFEGILKEQKKLIEENQKLNQEIKTREEYASLEKEKISVLLADLEELTEKNKELKKQNQDYLKNLEELKKEYDNKLALVDKNEDEKVEYYKEKIEEIKRKTSADKEQFSKKLTALENELNAKDKYYQDKLSEQKNDYSEENKNNRSKIQELKKKLSIREKESSKKISVLEKKLVQQEDDFLDKIEKERKQYQVRQLKYEDEVREIKKHNKDYAEKTADLQKQKISSERAAAENMEKVEKQHQEQIISYKKDIEKLEKEIAENQQKYKKEIDDLEKQLSLQDNSYKKTIAVQIEDKENKEKTILSQKAELEKYQDENKKSREKIAKNDIKIKTLSEKVDQLSRINEQGKDEVKQLRESNQEFKTALDDLKKLTKENQEQKKGLVLYENKLSVLKTDNQKLEQKNKEIEEQLILKNKKITEYGSLLEKKNSKELMTKLDQNKAEIDSLIKKVSDLNMKLKYIQKTNNHYKRNLYKLKSDSLLLAKNYRKLIKENNTKQDKLNTIQLQLDQKNKEFDEFKKTKNNSKDDVVDFEHDLKELQEQIEATEYVLKYIHDPEDNENLKEKISSYQNKLAQIKNKDDFMQDDFFKEIPLNIEDDKSTKIHKVPVLCYHSFNNNYEYSISKKLFTQQMDYLKKNKYKVISLKTLVSHVENNVPFKEKVCVITIDDGYASVYHTAYPILKKYNFPATLFIYTGDFIDHYSGALTWKQIREMMQHNIEVQSHSHTHPLLTKIRKGETYKDYLKRVKWELIASKKILENKLDTPVEFFSYPFGGYNKCVENLAKKAGYRALLNVDMGLNHIMGSAFTLKRITITRAYKIKIFAKVLKNGFF